MREVTLNSFSQCQRLEDEDNLPVLGWSETKETSDRSIEDFDKAIETNPNYATAYYNRGISHALSGYMEKSINDLQKACEMDIKIACKKLQSILGDRQFKQMIKKEAN